MATPVSVLLSSTLIDGSSQCIYNVTEPDSRVVTTTVGCSTTPSATGLLSSTAAISSSISTTSNQEGLPNSSGTSTSNPIPGVPLPEATNKPGVTTPTPGLQNGTSSSAGAAGSTVPATKGSKGVASGAVAGIAIGMLLAGALIAAIVFLFLLRRQRRRYLRPAAPQPRHYAPNTTRNVEPEKGATVTAVSRGVIDDLLPQPVEDGAIASDLSKIRDNIKNHVRTFYHSGPVSTADINEARIRDIAALTGTSAATIVSALANPTHRDIALRSIVGSVILTRCAGDRSPSLLPSDVVALSASTSANDESHSQSILYSKWKVITGALLQQRHGRQNQDPSRAQAFEDTVVSLESVLVPFVKGGVDGGQRRKNLDMILTRAANLAFLLFAQPGTFRFDFASPQGKLTVFPALIQTVGDHGQSLNPIKVLTEKEVAAV